MPEATPAPRTLWMMLRKSLCGAFLPATLAWSGAVAHPEPGLPDPPPPAQAEPGTAVPDAPAESAATEPPFAPVTLARPVEIRARLATGGSFEGRMERWDARALHGTFGTRTWRELAVADARRVFMQVMDRTSAAQWLVLGELLAAAPEGRAWADEAFRHAARAGAGDDSIAAARARAATEAARRADRERAQAERRLRSGGAGGSGGDAAPAAPPVAWPVLTEDEQANAAAECRRAFAGALETAGQPPGIVETRYFLLGGDIPREDLERLGREMDTACDRGRALLGLGAEGTPFWGKPSLIACATEDAGAVAAAAVARVRLAPGERGHLRTDGPRVDLIAWRGTDASAFRAEVNRLVGRALLHRAYTGAAVPLWVEAGVAEAVARRSDAGAAVDRRRRPVALRYLRGGGQAIHVLSLARDAGDWPGPDEVGPAVGYLAVEFLLARGPEPFVSWIRAMKGGKRWELALDEAYARAFARVPLGAAMNGWYLTNDGEPTR